MPQVRVVLQAILPRQQVDAATVIRLIEYIQKQNYAAYRAHRRRTLERLDKL